MRDFSFNPFIYFWKHKTLTQGPDFPSSARFVFVPLIMIRVRRLRNGYIDQIHKSSRLRVIRPLCRIEI